MSFTLEYHVPRSQVWEGSRGRQAGGVHLAATEDLTLTAKCGRATTLKVWRGGTLCRKHGWYERPVQHESDLRVRCSECERRAARYGIEWPEWQQAVA